jgi:hypothetical protein
LRNLQLGVGVLFCGHVHVDVHVSGFGV